MVVWTNLHNAELVLRLGDGVNKVILPDRGLRNISHIVFGLRAAVLPVANPRY